MCGLAGSLRLRGVKQKSWFAARWGLASFGAMSVVMSFGCGSVENDGRPDAPVADGAEADGPPAARCNLAAPFGAPVALAELNTTSEELQPVLSADELTVYFASNRPGGPGGMDLYVATRASKAAAFSTPALMNGINSDGFEGRATLTADGLTMYAELRRPGASLYHLERAVRASVRDSFEPFAPVTELNSASSDAAPYVLPDHSAIYFMSQRGGNGTRLYRAAHSGSTFAMPVLVSGTDLQGFIGDYPMLSADELTLMFPASNGTDPTDIYVAKRASLAEGFGKPVALSELNTPGHEYPGWLSSDGCVLYFARALPNRDRNIFVARRP